MRSYIFIISLFFITQNVFSQTDIKKEKARNRAQKEVAYIASFKELTDEQYIFLEDTFATKFLYVTTYGKGKNVTPEYRKAVIKKSSEWLTAEIRKKFSAKETEEILAIFKSRRNNRKK